MAEFSPKFKEALSLVQKPGRYTGGEPGSVYKDKDKVDVRMAFCFPDTYEIGMSFLGEKILYDILNRHENWWCERAFMPWTDMKEQMERLDIPLYCLESKDPLTDFDIIGFSLEYELCYTNILAMLRLSNIPLRAADRDGSWPLIIAGGPCVCNAEPMADFFDVMQLGECEQMLQDICAAVEQGKKQGWTKEQLLLEMAKIPGVYIPSFYDVTYKEDGRIEAVKPNRPGVPARVTKAIVKIWTTMSRLKTLWCLWSALCRIAPASRCCAAVCAAAGFARQASCTVPSASAAPSLSARAPASFAATPAMTS